MVDGATDGFVGVININNVIRRAFQSAFLGYYAFADIAGQGLVKRGRRLVLHHAFTGLKLYRFQANI